MDDELGRLEIIPCPHYDDSPADRCNHPSEVQRSYRMLSTNGPVEHIVVMCVLGHHFNGPRESMKF